MSKYQTETVAPMDLKVGDVIIAHGGLFRVIRTERFTYSNGDEVQANRCEFLGNAFDWECSIPKQWRDGAPASRGRPELDNFWNEQGNRRAQTYRVLTPATKPV